MLIVNEGLLVAAALEACDAKGLNTEFKLVSGTAGKLSPLVSFLGFRFCLPILVYCTTDDKFML